MGENAAMFSNAGAGVEDVSTDGGRRYAVRIVKCVVSAAFWCACEAWRSVRRAVGWPAPPVATILYYHRVRPDERDRFARQLDHLCRWATAIPADLTRSLQPGVRYAAVTFDDGWASVVDNAMPELERRNIPVTMFAIPGHLGRRLERDIDEPLISCEQLRQLAAKGVIIGSHTLTHCALTEIDEAAALYELTESRARLSRMLNQNITLFAFPFSLHDQRLVGLCRMAGYRRAFTGTPYMAHPGAGEFETGRTRVDPSDWKIEFHLKMLGAYRWLPAAFALKRHINRQIRRASELARAVLLSL
jgi:peptidoglycan/xylan/chitin deacetylase (PgdA/CDA1 family)